MIYGYDGFSLGIEKSFDYYGRISSVYTVKSGNSIGYGSNNKVKEDTEVGILEIGYIDSFGFYREYRKNFIYDVLKFIYRYNRRLPEVFKGNRKVKILSKPNMNLTLIDGRDLKSNDYVKIIMSPILGDSSIYKKYI